MKRRRILDAIFASLVIAASVGANELVADPPSLTLNGPDASAALLIEEKRADGVLADQTTAARYASSDPKVATVDELGVVRAIADGETSISVEAGGRKLAVEVRVRGTREPRRFHFENDILPILGKLGCNTSGCHGKAEGQNGFKLSIFGFDPAADHASLVKESRGRRFFPAAPELSLFLTKMVGAVPHGGGIRSAPDRYEYRTIRGWIEAGVPYGDKDAPKVESIRVEPRERVLEPGARRRLRVIARDSSGREFDVTTLAKYQSNRESLATVTPDGVILVGDAPGEVAVMANYMGAVDVFRGLIPRKGEIAAFPELPEPNRIDELVWKKLRKLNVVPSDRCSDEEYLRRVYLDVIGTLPTPEESRRFLANRSPDRREALVEELLKRPEYAEYWSLKWSDLLRVDRAALGHKRAYAYYRWIRECFAAGRPLDVMTRELVTAEGTLDSNGPANFYKVMTKPGETASTVSQVFLGVRIACAECHHHPFDRWSQTDYLGMLGFFQGASIKAGPRGEFVASGPAAGEVRHPRTGEKVEPRPLGFEGVRSSPATREAFAGWLTAPENPWYARNLANRYWGHFLGRGLVEPVDDVRATNPPSNPELLDALATILVESRFDPKGLIRAITRSRTYQTSSRPNSTNMLDEQNYSRATFKRIDAEVFMDMVCQVTGATEKYPGVPAGTRAIGLWDSKANHYFLKIFGRPARVSACECERAAEPSVGQVLHILNSPSIQEKLSDEGGVAARLVSSAAPDESLVDELFLSYLCRTPTADERATALAHLAANRGARRQAVEDLAWTLMNSTEFLFNH